MNSFSYKNNELYCESVPASTLAKTFGTPLYVYSRATLEERFQTYSAPLAHTPHQICYAVKANSNLALLELLKAQGAGFDIVSGGELARVLRAGADAATVVFSGVGKQAWEIRQALTAGIGCFNVESQAELLLLQEIAQELDKKAPVSLRVNPDVDAKTHPYISTGLKENKFGIDNKQAKALYHLCTKLSHIKPLGIDCHIGSQITELDPFVNALDKILHLVDELRAEGICLEHLDLGGGLGVRYKKGEPSLGIGTFVKALLARIGKRPLKLILEPGRSIMASAGILLTRTLLLKKTPSRHFAVVDAAMNDCLRPALYQSWHDIIPVTKRMGPEQLYDIVGPICETGDFLGKERALALEPDDLLAVCQAGAYCSTMASNYNTRARCAEVLVDKTKHYLIKEREQITDLFANEHLVMEL